MSDLDIETDVLIEGGRALRVVAQEFQDANVRSDGIAAAVGHPGLADRIREFAHGWDDTRKGMLEGIGFLAEAAEGVGTTFEEIEEHFVGALEGR